MTSGADIIMFGAASLGMLVRISFQLGAIFQRLNALHEWKDCAEKRIKTLEERIE